MAYKTKAKPAKKSAPKRKKKASGSKMGIVKKRY